MGDISEEGEFELDRMLVLQLFVCQSIMFRQANRADREYLVHSLKL